MKRHVGWVIGGLMFVAFAAPASAQVQVDVGVMAPNIGARVVVGGPRVVYVPVGRSRGPVHSRQVIHERRDDRHHRGRNRDRRDREYYRDVREARRDYERDLREARRDHERDLREAERDRRR